ncbi:hypothetical protein ACFE04_000135 [Oxalis oulophora]
MIINFIDNIDSSRDDWNILVRVARKWDVYNMQNEDDQFYIEMILLDEKGVAIAKYKQILKEGNVYNITNFKLLPPNDNYRPIKGIKKALFLLTTNATEVKDTTANIPLHYFKIATLQEIEERIADRIILTVTDELSLNSTTNTKIYINLPIQDTADISKSLCHRTLIFEIQLNEKNLKEGWQTYTVTKTFVPTTSLEQQNNQSNFTTIKGNNNPQNEIAESFKNMDKDNNIDDIQLLEKQFPKHIGEKMMRESKNKQVLEDTSDDITTNS